MAPWIPPQYRSLITGVKELYSSSDFTDLTISCRGKKWRVHRVCLGAQSEFFRKSLNERFKEGKEGTIHLDDDDPIIIETLLHYFYNFEYEEFAKERSGLQPLALDVKMFIIADKYFVPSLKGIAAQNFKQHASAVWNTQAFFDTIRDVYNQFDHKDSSNMLKKAIVNIVKEHRDELFNANNGYSCFLEVLGTSASFAKDVALVLAAAHAGEKAYECPNCGTEFSVGQIGLEGREFCCPNEICGCGYYDRDWWSQHERR